MVFCVADIPFGDASTTLSPLVAFFPLPAFPPCVRTGFAFCDGCSDSCDAAAELPFCRFSSVLEPRASLRFVAFVVCFLCSGVLAALRLPGVALRPPVVLAEPLSLSAGFGTSAVFCAFPADDFCALLITDALSFCVSPVDGFAFCLLPSASVCVFPSMTGFAPLLPCTSLCGASFSSCPFAVLTCFVALSPFPCRTPCLSTSFASVTFLIACVTLASAFAIAFAVVSFASVRAPVVSFPLASRCVVCLSSGAVAAVSWLLGLCCRCTSSSGVAPRLTVSLGLPDSALSPVFCVLAWASFRFVPLAWTPALAAFPSPAVLPACPFDGFCGVTVPFASSAASAFARVCFTCDAGVFVSLVGFPAFVSFAIAFLISSCAFLAAMRLSKSLLSLAYALTIRSSAKGVSGSSRHGILPFVPLRYRSLNSGYLLTSWYMRWRAALHAFFAALSFAASDVVSFATEVVPFCVLASVAFAFVTPFVVALLSSLVFAIWYCAPVCISIPSRHRPNSYSGVYDFRVVS